MSAANRPSISCTLLTLSEQSTGARHFLFKRTHSIKQSMIFSLFCQLTAWSSRYQRYGTAGRPFSTSDYLWLSPSLTVWFGLGYKLPAVCFCESNENFFHCTVWMLSAETLTVPLILASAFFPCLATLLPKLISGSLDFTVSLEQLLCNQFFTLISSSSCQ